MNFDLSAGVAILERTPSAFRSMLEGLSSDGRTRTRARTRGARTSSWDISTTRSGPTGFRARRSFSPKGPQRRFTPFDREAQFRESEGKSLAELLDEFAFLRAENLGTLAGWKLTDAQLSLEGEHPAFGLVTLGQLLSTWVVHDLGHIAQTARVMAKQYRSAIGPWRAYLPVVDQVGGPVDRWTGRPVDRCHTR